MSSKLREAVESLLDLLDDMAIKEAILLIARENRCYRESLHIDKKLEVLRKAKAALDLPLRNCDVGTPDEQYARFKKWCENEFYKRPIDALTGEPCKSCPCYAVSANGVDGCNYLRWANMPYEKGAINEQ